MASTSASHHTVAIIGGGPVGSLLAAELSRSGLNVVVLEAEPFPLEVTRLGIVHARSIQLLARRGYLNTGAAERGLSDHGFPSQGQSADFHFAGQRGLRIDSPAGEGPAIGGIAPSDLERMFAVLADARGTRIVRGASVLSVDQSPDEVTITYEHEGHTVIVRADWVVGCDGAQSIVRRSVGFPSTETKPTIAAMLGQVNLLQPHSVPPGWTMTDRGWTLINVDPWGKSRVITMDFTGPHADPHEPLTLDELQATASRIVDSDIQMADATFLTRFSDFSRLADRYRLGRVLLAGDAAHVHFPVGGQGLNLGIADVLNLAWKLILVAQGKAAVSLLDSYQEERHPAAAAALANTITQAEIMRPGSEHLTRRMKLQALLNEPTSNAVLGRMISAQDSPVSASARYGAVGDFLTNEAVYTPAGASSIVELLASGTRGLLLHSVASSAGRTASLWSDRVRSIPAVTTWDRDLLIRPDGRLAWVAHSSSLGGLSDALRRWFGPPSGGR
jgi:2-polyprenyl-6-methoxyphenol hydroxylase-like FAD-dependent oxidoreductase